MSSEDRDSDTEIRRSFRVIFTDRQPNLSHFVESTSDESRMRCDLLLIVRWFFELLCFLQIFTDMTKGLVNPRRKDRDNSHGEIGSNLRGWISVALSPLSAGLIATHFSLREQIISERFFSNSGDAKD